jgi:Holliday junction DNA helicase RuvA
MISTISGVVRAQDHGQVEVQLKVLGLGFTLAVPNAGKYLLNQDLELFTYLHWNQETGPMLFGFEDQAQRRLFIAMLSCSGIGPKLALAVLEQLGVAGFIGAIQQQDLKLLSTVSGIGGKKAEHIIVQLKHKIDKIIEHKEFVVTGGYAHITEVRSVLLSLKYSQAEVVRALDYIKQTNSDGSDTFDLALRRALSFLAKNV